MLDRRERSGDILAAMIAVQENVSSRLWVAMPGIIQSFDPSKRTCTVQPAIKARVQGEDGESNWVMMPLLVDCPVLFPGGGDVVLTFPLKIGDECLVHFSDRCIDAWYQNGAIQNQAELRMHDLSDGFVMPGPASLPRVEAGISATEAQMRSRDGVTKIRLDPAGHTVVVETTGASVTVKPNEVDAVVGASSVAVKPGEIDLVNGASSVVISSASILMTTTAASFNLSGGQCAVTGAFVINGHPYLTHHHSQVQPGTGNSGDVV